MERAVVDSSVLVSAFLTPGRVPDQVLDAAERGAFTLCLSRELLEETVNVLLDKREKLARFYAYTDEAVFRYAGGLLSIAELADDLPELHGAVPLDPKDDMIVATAVKAGAGYLVTGDRPHLLDLGAYEGIRMVKPRDFLDLLEAN